MAMLYRYSKIEK